MRARVPAFFVSWFVAGAAIAGDPAPADDVAESEQEAFRHERLGEKDDPLLETAGTKWPLLDWDRATHDWFGSRTWLDDRGILVEAFLTMDTSGVLRGGVDEWDTAFRYLLDMTLTLDAEKLAGLEGGTAFADFQVQHGKDGSNDVGDAQGISNIDADAFEQLARLWYEQVLWDGAVRLKVGKIDSNTEFAYVENGARFLNSSFGHSPNIVSMPTYPDPATSANVFVSPGAGLSAGFGVYDGAAQTGVRTGERGPRTFFGDPSDLFLIGEVGARWRIARLDRAGRAGVGGWRHTGDFERFDGDGDENGTEGFYAVFDHDLWREDSSEPDSREGIAGFLQYAWADDDVSAIGEHVGGGLVWSGFLPSRDTDVLGIGATWVRFTGEPGAGIDEHGETALEVFYRFAFTKWLILKPDLQYVVDPGGDAGVDDALVATLRVSITF